MSRSSFNRWLTWHGGLILPFRYGSLSDESAPIEAVLWALNNKKPSLFWIPSPVDKALADHAQKRHRRGGLGTSYLFAKRQGIEIGLTA